MRSAGEEAARTVAPPRLPGQDTACGLDEAPCARPLDAIDHVLRHDAAGITTARLIRAEEPFFQGHYPGRPILPGVFIIESVQQAASRFLSTDGSRARLEEVRSARFLSPVLPGDVLVCECRCARREDGRLAVEASCRVGTALAATVRLLCGVEGPGA